MDDNVTFVSNFNMDDPVYSNEMEDVKTSSKSFLMYKIGGFLTPTITTKANVPKTAVTSLLSKNNSCI